MGRIYDATWGRAFSALYDRCLKATEEAGLREMRARAAGRGAGPDDRPRRRHRRQPRPLPGGGDRAGPGRARPAHGQAAAARSWREAGSQRRDRRGAGAEDLPFEDAASTPPSSRSSSARSPTRPRRWPRPRGSLRPGGKLLFLEHVRADDPGLARWQDRLERPWRFLADGCHCNRDTVATIEASPLQARARSSRAELPKAPPIVKPLVRGSVAVASRFLINAR